jgi:hypothetical protein
VIPSTVRDGIKTALSTITGLRVYDTIPDGGVAPMAAVGQLSMTWDEVLPVGNLDVATLDVYVVVGRMNERAAQDRLDGYLAGSGAGSIRVALQADPTFSGSVKNSILRTATPVSATLSGVEHLAYRYSIELYG